MPGCRQPCAYRLYECVPYGVHRTVGVGGGCRDRERGDVLVPGDLARPEVAGSKVPALGYNVPYAVGNTVLTMAGPLLVVLIP